MNNEHGGKRQRGWNDIDGEKQKVESRDKVRHTKRSDQLYIVRMT